MATDNIGMLRRISLSFLLLLPISATKAQYAPGDTWYNNPLGFKPLELHTSKGFLIPAAAVAACLLLTKKDTSLKNRLIIYNELGMSKGYKYPYSLVQANSIGFNIQLRKFLAAGAEFCVVFPSDDFNATTGFAIWPFARFYLLNNGKGKIYFESGGGIVWLLDEYPAPTDRDARRGTYWNGLTKYGLAAEIYLSPALMLFAGARHLHISNGNTSGTERNPSHDSNGFSFGLDYKL